jgi:small subunit ribosomal protein S13
MIRIAGTNVSDKQAARFALSAIVGIGKSNVKVVLNALNIDFNTKLSELSEEEIVQLRNYIESNYILEADLRRQEQANIKRLIDINSHRGSRHKLGLPTRGQTTRTNSKTRRGKKSTSSVVKKKKK